MHRESLSRFRQNTTVTHSVAAKMGTVILSFGRSHSLFCLLETLGAQLEGAARSRPRRLDVS